MSQSSLFASILIMVTNAWDKKVKVRLDRDISLNIWAEYQAKSEIDSVRILKQIKQINSESTPKVDY